MQPAMGFFQAIYGVGMFIGPVITGFYKRCGKAFLGILGISCSWIGRDPDSESIYKGREK